MNYLRGVKESTMLFKIEVEQEVDGRWIAEVMDIPGVNENGAIFRATNGPRGIRSFGALIR
jgi:hypothetical protein